MTDLKNAIKLNDFLGWTGLRKLAFVSALALSTAFAPLAADAQDEAVQLRYKAAEVQRKAAQTPTEMQEVLGLYRQLADQGHARSAFRLGNILYRGTLVNADQAEGIRYYQQAAEGGFDPAWRYLAVALMDAERGEEAFEAYARATEKGLTGFELDVAMAHVGEAFGDKSDPLVGISLLTELSDGGNTEAAVELAKVYADPKSAFTDFRASRRVIASLDADEADNDDIYRIAEIARKAATTRQQMATVVATYEELASLDHARSAFRLGNILSRGTLVDEDADRGIAYYRQAASLGFTAAWRYVGTELLAQGQGTEALAAFESGLAAGETGFEVIMAKAHFAEDFGPASDPAKGIALLQTAASTGDIAATVELARIYAEPQTGFADFEKARLLAEPLAERNDPDALWILARLYQSGHGVERNYAMANSLYLKAADAGEPRALLRAADMEIRRGLNTRAYNRLMSAAANRVEGAELALAEAHIMGRLAKHSNRETGRKIIADGIERGDLDSVLLALDLRAERVRLGFDYAQLVSTAESAADRGNVFAAETLLRFARDCPGLVPNALARREAYLERYGPKMRPHAVAQERIHLTLDTKPRRAALAQIKAEIQEAEGQTLYHMLVGLSRADRNAYVYFLQSELAALGAYNGKVNGLLTGKTLRRILAFCAQEGYADECRHGPLRGTAVRLVAASIAMQRG